MRDFFALLFVGSLALAGFACGGDPDPPPPPPPPPPGRTPDAGDASMGGADASDASDAEMGRDVEVGPVDPYAPFIEEFRNADNVDTEMSSARVVTAGTGSADGAYPLISPGTGDEPFPAELTLAPGEHSYSYAVIREGIDIAGDATLHIRDDLSIESGGALRVAGDLDLGVGGIFDLSGRIEVSGDLRIHLNGTSRFTISSSGALIVGSAPSGDGGDIELYTRGPMDIQGTVSAGNTALFPGRGGSIVLRAYRDIVISGTGGSLRVGGGPGGDGVMEIYTEGELRVVDAPAALEVAPSRDAADVGHLWLHTGEGVNITSSMIWGTNVFDFDVQTRGSATFSSSTFTGGSGEGTGDFRVMAANISIAGTTTVNAATSDMTSGGGVYLLSPGTVTVGGSTLLVGGEGRCADGGTISIEAMESVAINGSPTLRGGNSETSPGCTAGSGGSVRLASASTITISGMRTDRLVPGMGSPVGEIAVDEMSAVMLPEIDPLLTRTSTLVSVPIGLMVPRVILDTVEPVWIVPEGTVGTLLLSPDGTEGAYERAEDLLTRELRLGFRYRVDFESRFFDSTGLDRFELGFAEAP